VPLLGDIPWIGELFQKRNESLQRTEFSIYIIPVLERPDRRETNMEDVLKTYYRRLGPGL
jgi:type II secretory pathway component GspD/PulD (secretin)